MSFDNLFHAINNMKCVYILGIFMFFATFNNKSNTQVKYKHVVCGFPHCSIIEISNNDGSKEKISNSHTLIIARTCK